MLIVSPIVWLSYLPLLAIPIFELVSELESTGRISRAFVAMTISVALVFTLNPIFPFLVQSRTGRLVAEYQFVALALAYLSICWSIIDGGFRDEPHQLIVKEELPA